MAPASELKPVYLLLGSDRPKVERALARLRARFADGAVESTSGHEVSGADAAAACNALGLFGTEGRLVIVEPVDPWKAGDVSALAAYLEDPAPAAVLALVGHEIKRDGRLAKLCAKVGEVLTFDIAKRDLPHWVAQQFGRLGTSADPAACRALIGLVGDDVHALASEVSKLATWAAGEPVDERAVELLAAPHRAAPPFAVTDAWGARDPGALMTACERAMERSPDAPPRVASRLVGSLTSHVGRVLDCQMIAAQGGRARDAAERLKIHRFVAEKAFAHARNYTRDELEDGLVRLADLDLALKGASRLPAELELERALVAITAPRRVHEGGVDAASP